MSEYRIIETRNYSGLRYDVQTIAAGRHLSFKAFRTREAAEAYIASRKSA